MITCNITHQYILIVNKSSNHLCLKDKFLQYNHFYYPTVSDRNDINTMHNCLVMHITVDLSLSLINVSLESPSKHSRDRFNPII